MGPNRNALLHTNVPAWWVLAALGIAGGGGIASVGNWQWLQNNEPRFQALEERLDQHNASIRDLYERKVSEVTRMEMLRRLEVFDERMERRIERIEQELLRDSSDLSRTWPGPPDPP